MSSFGFDPQRALDQIKKLAADAPAQLSSGFERVVRDTSPERLEQAMHSPARKPILDGMFWQMPRMVDAKAAAGTTTEIRWVITGRSDGGEDIYRLLLEDGKARTERGDGGDPRLTIKLDGVEFLKLASGNSDPMKAYFKGRIEMTGDIMVAAKLAQVFRMPNAPDPERDERDHRDPSNGDSSGGGVFGDEPTP
jgi:hypothetical protein